MGSRGGIRTATLLGLAALLLAAAAPGLLAKPRHPSTISLRTAQEGAEFVFRGRVRSEKPACLRRKVEITAGHFGPKSKPHLEGVTRTNRRGRYELRVLAETNTIGDYRAKALRKERPRFVCKAARSEIVQPGGSPFRPAAGG